MTKVLVICGGSSDERAVSLLSGDTVAAALRQAGYEVALYDPLSSPQSLRKAVAGQEIAFPVLHGSGGEDGTIQAQLEQLAIPYVGSGIYASELCFDKWNYRALLQSHGLPVAPGELVDRETFAQSSLIQQPYVLKPPKGGSSIDTILVHDLSAVDQAAITADFEKHRQLLLERLIGGIEITVGVVGEAALPVIEIIPPAGADFDFENKYNGASKELCPPRHVSPALQKRAQDLTLQIHKLCGCQDYSRTDIMISSEEELFVLETNTLPGMTTQSLLPKAAATAGMPMAALCDTLVVQALNRQTENV